MTEERTDTDIPQDTDELYEPPLPDTDPVPVDKEEQE